jgi:hypothetical protein
LIIFGFDFLSILAPFWAPSWGHVGHQDGHQDGPGWHLRARIRPDPQNGSKMTPPTPKMMPQTPHFDPQNDAPDPSFWIDFGIILEYVLMTYSLLFFLSL